MATANSDLTIINDALHRCEQASILDVNVAGRAGELARTSYERLRDSEMSRLPWNFCTDENVPISASGQTPPSGWDALYPVPPDTLRVWSVNGDENHGVYWRRSGNFILANMSSPIEATLIRRETTVGLWSPWFHDLVVDRLASEWCKGFSLSAQKREQLKRDYRRTVIRVKAIEGQEGARRSKDQATVSTFLGARFKRRYL